MGSMWKDRKDAVELLKCDHRQVDELFKQYEDAAPGDKVALAQEICQALAVHAHVEEQVFYPALRGKVSASLLDEAEVEHGTLKQLIAQIDGTGCSTELFDARVKVLKEYVRHHVKEEENEMMPQAQSSGVDLELVGREIAELKSRLEERIGELRGDVGDRVSVLEIDGRGVRHPPGRNAPGRRPS